MRVLLVNKRYPPHAQAGPAFSVQYLAEGLQRHGHEPRVLCRNPGPTETRRVRGITCVAVDEALPPGAELDAALRQLDEFQPDVVHVYFRQGFPVIPLLRAARERGVATMHTICTYSYLCQRGTRFTERGRCARTCSECAAASAPLRPVDDVLDGVVFVSDFVRRAHFAEGFFRNVPVQDVIWCSYDRDPNVPIRSVDLDATHPVRFGFLGRIDPAKGLPLLLPTFEEPALRAGAKLVVAGGAPADLLATRRAQFPSTTFLGFVPRETLFQQIDVLVVPSLWDDPLPRVIYEAYAHGIPVVGARRGGIAEAIDDGVTGLLFEPSEPQALEGALVRLMSDRERIATMSAAALYKSRSFSTAAVVPRYVDVYRRCMVKKA